MWYKFIGMQTKVNLRAVSVTVSGWRWGNLPQTTRLSLHGWSCWGWACWWTADSPPGAAGRSGPDCPWSVYALPSWSCPSSLPATENGLELASTTKYGTISSLTQTHAHTHIVYTHSHNSAVWVQAGGSNLGEFSLQSWGWSLTQCCHSISSHSEFPQTTAEYPKTLVKLAEKFWVWGYLRIVRL